MKSSLSQKTAANRQSSKQQQATRSQQQQAATAAAAAAAATPARIRTQALPMIKVKLSRTLTIVLSLSHMVRCRASQAPNGFNDGNNQTFLPVRGRPSRVAARIRHNVNTFVKHFDCAKGSKRCWSDALKGSNWTHRQFSPRLLERDFPPIGQQQLPNLYFWCCLFWECSFCLQAGSASHA